MKKLPGLTVFKTSTKKRCGVKRKSPYALATTGSYLESAFDVICRTIGNLLSVRLFFLIKTPLSMSSQISPKSL